MLQAANTYSGKERPGSTSSREHAKMRGHLSLRQVRAPSIRRGDWSQSEKSELHRLDAAFPPPKYDIECNTTEECDPWCVVYDCVQDGIAVHIARIDGRYAIQRPVK